MKYSKLREITLDLGPEVDRWPAYEQRQAVIELFEQDELATVPGKYPDWIHDCLTERVSCNERERKAIIAALKVDDQQKCNLLLGAIVARALLEYPIDSLQQIVDERFADWRAQEREDAETDELMRRGMRALVQQ